MELALQEADAQEPQAGQPLLLGLEDMQVSAQDARISLLSGQYPTDETLLCSRGSCFLGLFARPTNTYLDSRRTIWVASHQLLGHGWCRSSRIATLAWGIVVLGLKLRWWVLGRLTPHSFAI